MKKIFLTTFVLTMNYKNISMQYKSHLITLAMVLFILGLSEAISALALAQLSLSHSVAYPWTWLFFLYFGLYNEVLLSISAVGLPLALGSAFYLTKGVWRYLSYCLTGLIFLGLMSFCLGISFFHYWEPNISLANLKAVFISALVYKHFVLSQVIAASIITLASLQILFEKIRPANKVLGNAHFASGLSIQKAGFFKQEPESIIIGKKFGAPLYANGFEHVLVFAPTGSGKTRSIAIPNLFNYPYSVVCNDIKFSLFATTSGYREKVLDHQCYCFAPARDDGRTHQFNPLFYISQDKTLRIRDIQRIAHILMPDNPKSDPIWQQASRKLFKTLVLYLLDTETQTTTLGEINRLVKQQNFDEWLMDMLENTTHYDAEFYRNGYSYITNHEKTRKSILESFSGYFELFDDPIVDAATSGNDFDLRDLRRQKMTIYVGFSDDDMERLAPLLTLFWQQLISVMVTSIPDLKEEPYPLLCLIDEFSSLGRIERLRRSLKLLREYRVRCILMFQYIAQTYEKYSHDEAKAFTNIKTKVAYGSEDPSDAEFISKMLGTRTKKIVSRSVSAQSGGGINESKSISYQAIPLLRPEQIMKLSMDVSLIIRTGHAPVRARQFIWYKEGSMYNLPEQAICIPVQKIKLVPFKPLTASMDTANSIEALYQ